MSPPWVVGALEAGVVGVERDSTIERLLVVDEELAPHRIGGVDVASGGQAQLAAQAMLQHTPEAFDAAFGLRRSRGNEADAELGQRAAELRGLALASEFFLDTPVVVIAEKDAAAITVEGGGHAEAAEQTLEQAKITCGGFRGEELCCEDFVGSVVLHTESGETQATAFQPIVNVSLSHRVTFSRCCSRVTELWS
jgi:hypothetical protein